MSEILGKCPKCGKNVHKIESYNFYACEDKECKFTISGKIFESEVSEEDVKKILAGEETELKSFTWNNGSTGEARLKYDVNQDKIVFIFEDKKNDKSPICKCPCCGNDVILIKDKYYVCSAGKDKCGFIISKEISGAILSDEDIKVLCSGKETDEKSLVFRSGNPGNAKLKYNKEAKKIEYVFDK
ncbi:hypothetical protein C4D27_17925 [Clostridium perfringens]